MIVRLEVLLDDSDPEQAKVLRKIFGWVRDPHPAVPVDFVNAVKATKTGKTIVLPLVKMMKAGRQYSPTQLADLLNLKAVVLGKRFTVLGRTEKRFGGIRIFTRHGAGRSRHYSVTPEMKAAFS